MKTTLFLVPMKDPSVAKTRLSGSLNTDARRKLAEALYKRTLAFLTPIARRAQADLAVVTGASRPAEIARDLGVTTIPEPFGADLNAALQNAASFASRRGYARICIIPADLAAPRADDLETLLHLDGDVVICPSQDGGTNALLVSPPSAIDFQFGLGSARRHMQAGRARGLSVRQVTCDSLSFDIDTEACLNQALVAVPDLAKAVA